MENEKRRQERKEEISNLNRADLEFEYMNLYEISLQKTRLINRFDMVKKTGSKNV